MIHNDFAETCAHQRNMNNKNKTKGFSQLLNVFAKYDKFRKGDSSKTINTQISGADCVDLRVTRQHFVNESKKVLFYIFIMLEYM